MQVYENDLYESQMSSEVNVKRLLPPNLARALAKGTVMSCSFFFAPFASFAMFFIRNIS